MSPWIVFGNIIFALVAFVYAMVANSFLEWFVHGEIMHRGWGNRWTNYLEANHPAHHRDFPPHNSKNPNHSWRKVHLPLWAFPLTVSLTVLPASFISYLSSHGIFLWTVLITSSVYYWVYQYMHTRDHVPRKRWFENRESFIFLDIFHAIHHTFDENDQEQWRNPVNLCIVFPLADFLMGTAVIPPKYFSPYFKRR